VARLKRGVTPAEAQANLNVSAGRMDALQSAGSSRCGVSVIPILDEIYGAARPAIWILFGAVALVLTIACANAANLLLVRAAERGREIAVRAALGAGRGRLIRLLLSESLALAAVAGSLGLAGAAAGVKLLVRFAPAEIPRMDHASVDWPMLASASP
jgi:putative ABC transport system permease protein